MALVQGGVGGLSYYDMADLDSPVELWRYEKEMLIGSTSVNTDGSLIAFLGGTGLTRSDHVFYVVDRNMRLIGTAPLQDGMCLGVMFVDHFLFTGIQYHRLPAYVHHQSTNRVDLYRLK